MGVAIRGGLDKATEDGIVLVVHMTGAAVVGARALNSGGVDYAMSSLKVAPRLLETGVFITSTDMD